MNINEYQNYHETKAHTSAEFPYNTYLCSIPLDFPGVPLHWHDELELVVIKRGQGFVSVTLISVWFTVEILLLFPLDVSMPSNRMILLKWNYENIIFKPDLLSSGANDLCMIQYIVPLLDGSLPIEYFLTPALGSFEALSNCIRQIDLVCADQTPGWQLAVKSSLFNFFFLLISESQKKTVSTYSNSKSLEKMKTVFKIRRKSLYRKTND